MRSNTVRKLRLRVYGVRENNNGTHTLTAFIAGRKKDDGTYPVPVWLSVYIDKKRCKIDQDDIYDYEEQLIQVNGQLTVSSYINKEGTEVPTITIWAERIGVCEYEPEQDEPRPTVAV